MIRTGYLGLGSNVGKRLEYLRAVPAALAERGVEVSAASSVYATAPVGEVTEQRDFLNACLRVETALDPLPMLDACKAVEGGLGRRSGPRHGPRPIDVDLLLLGCLEMRTERLTLPHGDITRRRFVLLPLLELDAELRLPDGRPLAAFLPEVEGQRVERVASFPAAAAGSPAGAPPAR